MNKMQNFRQWKGRKFESLSLENPCHEVGRTYPHGMSLRRAVIYVLRDILETCIKNPLNKIRSEGGRIGLVYHQLNQLTVALP